MRSCGATIPRQHAAVWNSQHTQGVLVLDDLHCWSAAATAGTASTIETGGAAMVGLAATEEISEQPADVQGAVKPCSQLRRADAHGEVVSHLSEQSACAPVRSPHQRLALNATEARAALRWLARLHALCWRGGARDGAGTSDAGASGVDAGDAANTSGASELWERGAPAVRVSPIPRVLC